MNTEQFVSASAVSGRIEGGQRSTPTMVLRRHVVAALRPAFVAAWIASAALARNASAVPAAPATSIVRVRLSEWKVALSTEQLKPGRVAFRIINAGTIPHAFEVEGKGIEKEIAQLAPGDSVTLTLTLASGRYEAYCPVGSTSHKMLGMRAHFDVAAAGARPAPAAAARAEAKPAAHDMHGELSEHMGDGDGDDDDAPSVKAMRVTGGGPVVHILPGPFPFADSAAAMIRSRPKEQQDELAKKAEHGPYSNNVARIEGTVDISAIDHGASGDSVSGVAEFTTEDGARWKLVMDRVQTKDIPFNPRFGGVIMGLFYHGASNVHTPLVPTIQSSLALWAFGHLDRNGERVTDDAMVHMMLLSRTRRDSDFALECWDCSHNPVEELQLQITPAPGTPAFNAPGGVLFVNWEKSAGAALDSK